MQEKRWQIVTPDGANIYGSTTQAAASPADRAVVIVHGLTGHMNEYKHKTAAAFFARHGHDVIRFNLYDSNPGGRQFQDCTLSIHAADLNTVLTAQSSSYGKIFIIGHSFGGPTIMAAQPARVTAVSLWDPTFNLPARWKERPDVVAFGSGEGQFLRMGGQSILIGPAMIDEAIEGPYDVQGCLALSRAFNRPIQVLHAGDHGFAQQDTSWHSAGHPANERQIIPGADHGFHNGAVFEQVLALTQAWFARFSNEMPANEQTL